LLEITTWRRHAELLSDFDLIAVDRPGRELGTTLRRLPAEVASRLISVPFVEGAASRLRGPPPGAGGRIYHLPIPAVEISSSQVRGAAAAGSELSGLVPPSVARYIQAQGLYRREERR
jgi:nicotinic acid mononucleotide adenylyltransferase